MHRTFCIYFMIALIWGTGTRVFASPFETRIENQQRINRFFNSDSDRLEVLDLKGFEGLHFLFSNALMQLQSQWPRHKKVGELMKVYVADTPPDSPSEKLVENVRDQAAKLLLEFSEPSSARNALVGLFFQFDLWSPQTFFFVHQKIHQAKNLELYYPVLSKMIPFLKARQKQLLHASLSRLNTESKLKWLLLSEVDPTTSDDNWSRILELASIEFAESIYLMDHDLIGKTAYPSLWYSVESQVFALALSQSLPNLLQPNSRLNRAFAYAQAQAEAQPNTQTYRASDRQRFFYALQAPGGLDWLDRRAWMASVGIKVLRSGVKLSESADGKVVHLDFCQSRLQRPPVDQR